MDNGIYIDNIKKGDLPEIQRLYKELIAEGVTEQTLLHQYNRIAEDSSYCILVARCDRKVLGTAMGILCQALDAPFMVIENVVVDEACRKQGIGKKIFAALDEFAEENNCQYALLVSSGFRKEAHRFYEAMGYDEDVRGFRKYY